MALVHANRVKETSTTTGTGTYDLAGAVNALFRTFVAGIGNGNTCYYVAVGADGWEVGVGTVTDASPDTLARTTVLDSSNGGSAVDWGAGTKTLFCGPPVSLFQRFALLDYAQAWTAVQGYTPSALTYAASQTWDVSAKPIAVLSPTGNVTSFSVSGVEEGRLYILKVVQDSSPRTIVYTGANFKFIGGAALVLSTGSGAIDYYFFIGTSTSTLLHEIGRAQAVA